LIFGIAETRFISESGDNITKRIIDYDGYSLWYVPWVIKSMEGVAMGMNPPKYFKDGDTVEVFIEKIGTLRHTVHFE